MRDYAGPRRRGLKLHPMRLRSDQKVRPDWEPRPPRVSFSWSPRLRRRVRWALILAVAALTGRLVEVEMTDANGTSRVTGVLHR
jgi:hypothetical protein